MYTGLIIQFMNQNKALDLLKLIIILHPLNF